MSVPFYSRFLEVRLEHRVVGPEPAKLVMGARQVGKTTLLRHFLADSEGILVVNLQDRRERQRYERDSGRLVRELEASPNIHTVFIDEVQKVPGLLEDAQYLYDAYPGRYQLLLTGSSARQLKRRAANLLPGRVHNLLLSPALLAEQRDCELLSLKIPRGPRFPLRALEDYLIYGNLPGLYQTDRETWVQTLAAYSELYIENEIRQEHIIDDVGSFQRFLRLAALEAGQHVNFTKMARAIGVAPNTIRNYFQVLEDTHVAIGLWPFTRARKRITQAPRFLFFDIGVRHVVAGLPLSESLLVMDAGHIFEQFVLTELWHRCSYRGAAARMWTWRTSSGAEVDAVLETPDETIPIEIKWTEDPSPRDARHLETFMNLHPNSSRRGYVICRTPMRQQLTPRTIAIPWSEL